jgi:hypothetical protein
MTPPYTEVAEQIRQYALSLLAAAQNGLAYTSNPYDRQRYQQVRRSAEELMGLVSVGELEQVRRIVSLDSGYMTPTVADGLASSMRVETCCWSANARTVGGPSQAAGATFWKAHPRRLRGSCARRPASLSRSTSWWPS